MTLRLSHGDRHEMFEHSCSTIPEEELTWTQWFFSVRQRVAGSCCLDGLNHWRLGNLSPARRWRQATEFLLAHPTEDRGEQQKASGYSFPSWLGAKHEFINDLLEAQWPYISEWFDDIMRKSCEPALQALMPTGITIEFGERCSLGTKPAKLENIVASKFTEDHGTSIRLDAQLNYSGDCHVDVVCTVGSLELTRLEVKGEIVIELVRLRKQPPWFSGVRIYFSNRPKIDLILQTQLFGMDANFAFLKQKIVDALTGVISNQAVLPNRFCIPMGDAIGLVDLKSPAPQGILRLVILEAKDLPDPGRSHWSNMMLRFGFSAEATDADPFVQASIGAQVQKTSVVTRSRAPQWEDETFDFVIDDPNLQNLNIAVHDNDTGAFSWKQAEVLGCCDKKLTALLEGQQLMEAGTSQLPEIWLPLGSGLGNLVPSGSVKVRAEWRPLASTGSSQINLEPNSGLWSIGPKNQHEWLLVVDTLSASALPRHGLGLNHWVKLSIRFDGAEVGPTYATGQAHGAGPLEHGKHMLETMGIRPEICQILQSHPERIYSLWRSHVPAVTTATDMEQKGTTVYGLTGPPVFVDAVWNHNSRILLDSLPSMSLVLTVMRLEKGQRNPNDGTVLGSASMPLEELRKTHQCRFEGLLPLGKDKEVLRTLSHVQVRLRLHALATPPVAGSSYAAKPSRLSRKPSAWYDAVSVKNGASAWARLKSLSFGPKESTQEASDPITVETGLASDAGPFIPVPPSPVRPSSLPGATARSRRFVLVDDHERVSDAEYHEVEDCEVACEPSEPSLMGRISQIAAHVRRVSAR